MSNNVVLNKFGKLNKSNMDCILEALKESILGETVVVECPNKILAEQAYKKTIFHLKSTNVEFLCDKDLLSITFGTGSLIFNYLDEQYGK
jgi:hypothetical protein